MMCSKCDKQVLTIDIRVAYCFGWDMIARVMNVVLLRKSHDRLGCVNVLTRLDKLDIFEVR